MDERGSRRSEGWVRHHHRGLWGFGGLAVIVWLGGWSLSGCTPPPTPGSTECVPTWAASTVDYLTGAACPPEGFASALGYEPALVRTDAGWRFTKPAAVDGKCSGPLGGLRNAWGFESACRTHDYGYDLVRFGVGDRAAADDLFYRDLMTLCRNRNGLSGAGCRTVAHWAKGLLDVGDWTGFDPEPDPR